MHHRFVFAGGLALGHLFHVFSQPGDPRVLVAAEAAALREEIVITKEVLKGVRESQQSLEWLCRIQGKFLQFNILLDILAVLWFIWYCSCRQTGKRVVSDTGVSSSDSDEPTSGTQLAIAGRLDTNPEAKVGVSRKWPFRPSHYKGSKASWK